MKYVLNSQKKSHAGESAWLQTILKVTSFIVSCVMIITLIASPVVLYAEENYSSAETDGWVKLSESEMKSNNDIASFDFSVSGENYSGNFRFGSYIDNISPDTASLFQLTYYLTNKDTKTSYSYLYSYGSSGYVNLYEHEMGDSEGTKEIVCKTVDAVYIKENYPSNGLTSVKAVGKNKNYEIELTLIPNRYGTVVFETKLTPIEDKAVSRNFLWRLDTEMSYLAADASKAKNDAVPVYSMGKEKGLYIKDSTMALIAIFPHTSSKLNGPDAYQALKFSELKAAFGGADNNFSDNGSIEKDKDELLLAANSDSSVLFVWRNRSFSKAEPMVLSYQAGLASATENAAAPELTLSQNEKTLPEKSELTISGTWYDQDSDEVTLWARLAENSAVQLCVLKGTAMTSNGFEHTLTSGKFSELGVLPSDNVIGFYVVDEGGNSFNVAQFNLKVKATPVVSVEKGNGGAGSDTLIVKVEDGMPFVISGSTNQISKDKCNYFIKLESKEPINVNAFVFVDENGVLKIEVPYGNLLDYVDSSEGVFVVGVYVEDSDTNIRSNVDTIILNLVKLDENPTVKLAKNNATISSGAGLTAELTWFDNQDNGVIVSIKNLKSGNIINAGEFAGGIGVDNKISIELTYKKISTLLGDDFIGTAELEFTAVDKSGNSSNFVVFSLKINPIPKISVGTTGNSGGSNKPIVVSKDSGLAIEGNVSAQTGDNYGFYIKVDGKEPINVSEYVIIGEDGSFKLDIPYSVLSGYVGNIVDGEIEFYAVDETTNEQSQPFKVAITFDSEDKKPDNLTQKPNDITNTGQGGQSYLILSSIIVLAFISTIASYGFKNRKSS